MSGDRYSAASASYRAVMNLKPEATIFCCAPSTSPTSVRVGWNQELLFDQARREVRREDLEGVNPFSLLAVPGLTAADQPAAARQFTIDKT